MAFGIRAEDGTVGAPIYSFANDTDTGLYRIGANNVGVAANGAKVWEWSTGGITLASGKALVYGDGTSQSSAPGIVRISEQVLASAASSISFTSIAATYRSLRLVVFGRSNVAGSASNVSLRFNADSGANYDWQESRLTGTAYTGSVTNADSTARFGTIPGNTATASVFGSVDLLIPNYASASYNKCGQSTSVCKFGTTSSDYILTQDSVFWRSNSAITQIDIFTQNQWVTGSVATLYGIL